MGREIELTEDPSELYGSAPGFKLAAAHHRGELRGSKGDKAAGRRRPSPKARSRSPTSRSGSSRSTRWAATGRRVLLVLQAMDTAGKGGIVKHVVGAVDPQGVQLAAFKKPTDEELEHDFLWRVERRLPASGLIGVFDRSHYEDVLIGRARQLAPPDEIERRYGAINEFEKRDRRHGHADRQGDAAHLARRAEVPPHGTARPPDKHWKYNPGDVDERELWPSYMAAYQIAFERTRPLTRRGTRSPPTASGTRGSRCSTCCWRRSRTSASTGRPDFDVEAEKARLAAS